MNTPPILSIREYRQHFFIHKNLTVRAVDGISLDLREGEIVGLVGESGCGKSTVARGIMGLYTPTSGKILLDGHIVSDRKAYRAHKTYIQRNMQVIFQDSAAALNPRMTVAESIAEPLLVNGLIHKNTLRDTQCLKQEVGKLLDMVGLDSLYGSKFPAEISGGQRQRVAIARSLAIEPRLLVADEPVASLDVSIQAQIVTLFQQLQREHGLTLLFIAHDLSMVRWLCQRVAVMYAGKLVEMASADELFRNPLHPYTQALLSAVPVPDPEYERSKIILSYTHDAERMNGPWREILPDHFLLG